MPSQLSAMSQMPTETRHEMPAFPGGNTQPRRRSQASAVQGLPSLQVGAGPPTHEPPAQRSEVVQAF
jgi:hypothetical protein